MCNCGLVHPVAFLDKGKALYESPMMMFVNPEDRRCAALAVDPWNNAA